MISTVTLLSCNNSTEIPSDTSANAIESQTTSDSNVALKFINAYAEICTPGRRVQSDTNWIERNQMLTDNFKITYKNLLDSARQGDPELGLGFDPIFDAQDFPDKGFELVNYDDKTGYVTVKGKDWTDFILVLKVVHADSKLLVDGSGVINISVDKRAKR